MCGLRLFHFCWTFGQVQAETLRFLMTTSTVFPVNPDRRFASACAPLSGIFVNAFNRALGRINSGGEIFQSRISNRYTLMATHHGLRIRWAGSIIPGGRRPMPPIRCLRYDPPNTHILLSRLCVIESLLQMEPLRFLDCCRLCHSCSFAPFGRLFLSPILPSRMGRLDSGSAFLRPVSGPYPNL